MRRIDWDAQPLGKISDVDLAASLGVARQLVSKHRKARHIPPTQENQAWVDARRTAELRIIALLDACTGGFDEAAIADEVDLEERFVRSVLADLYDAGVVRRNQDDHLGRRLYTIASIA